MLAVALASFLATTAHAQSNGHYVFSGPLSSFTLEGATIGTPTSGLPFTIAISDAGNKISSDFTLTGPMWQNPIHFHLKDAKFANGHLTGTAQFKNDSGKVLEGLRLDIAGATESYDDAGQTKVRSQSATMAAPLLFGDLQTGDNSDAEPIDIAGLALSPTTKELDVTLKLSGIAYLGDFSCRENMSPGMISTDAKGRVYTVDHSSGLWRTEADGTQPQLVGKWGDATDYAFVDPATGNLIGHESNTHRLVIDNAAGEEKGKIPASEDFARWPGWARVDARGNLYVSEENHVCIYRDGNKVKDVESVEGIGVGDPKWDVTSDGTVFLGFENAIYRLNPDLTSAKKILFGPDWHLGRVTNVASMRVDPAGNLYILEGAAENFSEWPRISVFDKNGHFVRVFGRGGKAPKEGDETISGGVGKNLYDLAVGPDGRVYVSCDVSFGRVLMFMPF